jgi:branched-subunit amino acid aminotransferase/4-amino-4-deoxychorismate lyase
VIIILNEMIQQMEPEILSLALYGQACFTSFYACHGAVKGLELHFERLRQDSLALFGSSPSKENLLSNIRCYLKQQQGAMIGIRVTIFPAGFSLAHPGSFSGFNILVTGRVMEDMDSLPIQLATVAAQRTIPSQKTVNMIANIKARAKAQNLGADDALMLEQNVITEGSTWNIFFGKGQTLITPSLESNILSGITRGLLIELANDRGISCQEAIVSVERLQDFEFAFITNALIGVRAVSTIDQHSFDTSHPLLIEMQRGFEDIVGQPLFY